MQVPSTLCLDRFCGRTLYPVKDVPVYVDLPHEDEEGVLLNLEFHCGPFIETSEPEEERLMYQPTVEVSIPIVSTDPAKLVGTKVQIHDALDQKRGTWNRIYVYAHEDLWDISAHLLERRDDQCRVSLVGTARDPNFYDGSKANTKVTIDAWFSLAAVAEAHQASRAAGRHPASE